MAVKFRRQEIGQRDSSCPLTQRSQESSVVSGGSSSIQSESRERASILVLDGLQSWVVCAAIFVILFGAAVFGRALAITFLEFVQKFETSITTASLSFTLHLLAISISCVLVTSLIVPVTGERVACVTGAVGNFLCTICIGLAPNMVVFLFLMAAKGICTGMTVVPAITLISQYFDKRRSLATALANCGLSAGCMVAPPVTEYLLQTYGTQGTFLLIAALEMHTIAAAMLLRPVSRYKIVISSLEYLETPQPDSTEDSADTTDQLGTENVVENYCIDNEGLLAESKSTKTHRNSCERSFLSSGTSRGSQHSGSIAMDTRPLPTDFRSPSGMSISRIPPSYSCNLNSQAPDFPSVMEEPSALSSSFRFSRMRSVSESDSIATNCPQALMLRFDRVPGLAEASMPDASMHELNTCIVADGPARHSQETLDIQSNSYVHSFGSKYISLDSIAYKDCLAVDRKNRSRLSNYSVEDGYRHYNKYSLVITYLPFEYWHRTKVDEQCYCGTTVRRQRSRSWSIVSAAMSEFALDVQVYALESQQRVLEYEERRRAESFEEDNGVRKTKSQNVRLKVFDFLQNVFSVRLLQSWSLRCLLLSSVTGTVVQYIPTYLPTLAVQQGLSPDKISLLLFVGGAVDLISRVFIGACTDLHILEPSQIVAIAQIVIGTICHFCQLYTSFELLMFLSVACGMFGGVRQNLGMLLTIQFIGVEKFLKALGFQSMFGTLSLAIHHPLLSSILEVTGSFAAPLHYVGVAMYISSTLLLLEPIAKRLDATAADNKLSDQQSVDIVNICCERSLKE